MVKQPKPTEATKPPLFAPGARVRNVRTNETATVMTRDQWCPAAATTLEYDDDVGQLWNTPTHKLETIEGIR